MTDDAPDGASDGAPTPRPVAAPGDRPGDQIDATIDATVTDSVFDPSAPVTTHAPPTVARRLVAWFLGTGAEARLVGMHCVHSIAEAFFVVSMAGSIFFSVSPDAARPRVLLFLMITLGPFLVMAPLIGPFVDRLRGGLVSTAFVTFVIRSVLAVALAQHLRTLLLFPLAFGILVTAKTYTVARNGLVPTVVDDRDDLVAANARLSRSATIAGALGGAAAFGTYGAASASWTLRIAAVVYLCGAVLALALRRRAKRPEPVSPGDLVALVQPDVSGAIRDMMALRAATGFALFQFGFSLRAAGEPVWVLGAVVVGNSAGAFAGTLLAPVLRRHMSERSMFTVALIAPAATAVVAAVAFSRITLVVGIFVLGASVSIGRRALDATIQREAPRARRGQVYAGIETRLELAWVAAACLAVAIRVASWIGVLALAGFLAVVAIVHLRHRVGLRVLHPTVVAPLPERLLLRAETLADHGFYDEAIVLARLALDDGRLADVDPDAVATSGESISDRARAQIARAHRRLH